jgi:hypothetical protein
VLYDPKWEGPSLASFIAWLETQNPREKYAFYDCNGRCLLGQYMRAMGIPWEYKGDWETTPYMTLGRRLFGNGKFNVLHDNPWTFGAALKRARAFALTSCEREGDHE